MSYLIFQYYYLNQKMSRIKEIVTVKFFREISKIRNKKYPR